MVKIKSSQKISIPIEGNFTIEKILKLAYQNFFLQDRGPIREQPTLEAKSLLPIDETEEFHDPFSDLNLFLARRVKEELLREKNKKNWSHKIASLLFKEILPEFTKKFPTYRLGQNALKKTWENVRYYLDRFQEEKKALYPNGKLNIEFLIRKNLANWKEKSAAGDPNPYQTATKLAGKISECIALINGERSSPEKLTEVIWSMQKHLLPRKVENKVPTESYDPLDRIIVRMQLEELATNPLLSSQTLRENIRSRLRALQFHPFLASVYIEHPEGSAEEIFSQATKNFKKVQTLALAHAEEKIWFWSLHHDMVASFLHFPEETPYLRLLREIAPRQAALSLQEVKEKTTTEILALHPSLSHYKEYIEQRVVILYKYLWYTAYRDENESCYQRFLKWHAATPSSLREKMVPLMPTS